MCKLCKNIRMDNLPAHISCINLIRMDLKEINKEMDSSNEAMEYLENEGNLIKVKIFINHKLMMLKKLKKKKIKCINRLLFIEN